MFIFRFQTQNYKYFKFVIRIRLYEQTEWEWILGIMPKYYTLRDLNICSILLIDPLVHYEYERGEVENDFKTINENIINLMRHLQLCLEPIELIIF